MARRAYMRIKELRREKSERDGVNVTQQMLSDETGIAIRTISRMETGTRQFLDVEILEKLCDYFECELSDLIWMENNVDG